MTYPHSLPAKPRPCPKHRYHQQSNYCSPSPIMFVTTRPVSIPMSVSFHVSFQSSLLFSRTFIIPVSQIGRTTPSQALSGLHRGYQPAKSSEHHWIFRIRKLTLVTDLLSSTEVQLLDTTSFETQSINSHQP